VQERTADAQNWRHFHPWVKQKLREDRQSAEGGRSFRFEAGKIPGTVMDGGSEHGEGMVRQAQRIKSFRGTVRNAGSLLRLPARRGEHRDSDSHYE